VTTTATPLQLIESQQLRQRLMLLLMLLMLPMLVRATLLRACASSLPA
jgi:hypothetical protein